MTTNSSAENHRPTIYIDADGCPVVDITIRVARAKHLSCIIMCDTSHVFEKEGAKTITVDGHYVLTADIDWFIAKQRGAFPGKISGDIRSGLKSRQITYPVTTQLVMVL